jgi:threonine dehydratase
MERVRAAESLLRQVVPESRLVKTSSLSTQGDGQVFLKLESEGPTGSFKVRGAYHAIDVRQKQSNDKLPGVVTSSAGNHGAAVAYAASTR